MKRKILIVLLVVLCLAGCARADDPYRVDTVVYIPEDPTSAPTEAIVLEATDVPTAAEPTAAEIEEVAEETETTPEVSEPAPTEEAKKTTSSGNKTSSNKTSSSNKNTSSNKNNGTTEKATEPAATEPPATEAPATEPVETEPSATETPVTEPDETEVPATEPAETEPEPTDPPLYDISGYSVGGLEYAMKDAINAYRREAGLGELSLSSRLCAIASCRGYEISQVWSHTRPDGRGHQTVLSDYGYGGYAQELLVYVSGSGDGQAIIDKWMASDSHRDLLMGGYSTIGIGVYRTGGYTYVACLLVG